MDTTTTVHKTRTPKARLSIACFFAGLSAVIVGGFIGVILLLTLSQRRVYTDAVNQKIDLAQQKANLTVLEPLIVREKKLDTLVIKMMASPSAYIASGGAKLEDLLPFFNDIHPIVTADPLIFSAYQLVELDTMNPAGTMKDVLDVVAMAMPATPDYPALLMGALAQNGTMDSFITPVTFYPIAAGMVSAPFTYMSPFDVTTDVSFRNGFVGKAVKKTTWYPDILAPSGVPMINFAYETPIAWRANGDVKAFVGISLNTSHLTETVVSARVSDATTILLADVTRGVFITSSEADFFPFDEAKKSLYKMATVPHPKMREMYRVATERCPPETCVQDRFEHDGDIISSMSIRTNRVHLLLVQSTPHSHFFGEWDRNLGVGIAVGVVVCLLALATSVCVWFLINRNIATLQEAMELASEMQNDEADALSTKAPSLLSEIGAIQSAFESMNQRLMLARPFLPQSLLAARIDEDAVEEEGDGGLSAGASATLAEGRSVATSPNNTDMGRSARVAQLADATTVASRQSVKRQAQNGLSAARTLNTLQSKTVAVLSINVRGYHEMIAGMLPDGVQRSHTAMSSLVEGRANAEKGIVDSLHGDRFIVTFNVARPVAHGAQVAAGVALGIVEDAEARGVLGPRHPFTMGLSCGRALVGTMGSDTIKRLCTVGAVYPEAVALERVSRWVGTPVVASERARAELELTAHCLYLGRARLTRPRLESGAGVAMEGSALKEGGDSMGRSANPTDYPAEVHAVMERIQQSQSEEWLYAINHSKEGNPFKELDSFVRRVGCDDWAALAAEAPRLGIEAPAAAATTAIVTAPAPQPFAEQPILTKPNQTPRAQCLPRSVEWARRRAQAVLAAGRQVSYDLSL